jgi:hypothetical protein
MVVKATDVQRGMPVFGSDEHQVGCVVEVYGTQFGPDGPGVDAPTGAAPGGTPLPFLTVEKGTIARHCELQVPTEAVETIVPGERVVLRCPSSECERQYAV